MLHKSVLTSLVPDIGDIGVYKVAHAEPFRDLRLCQNQNIHYPTMHHNASVCALLRIDFVLVEQLCQPLAVLKSDKYF